MASHAPDSPVEPDFGARAAPAWQARPVRQDASAAEISSHYPMRNGARNTGTPAGFIQLSFMRRTRVEPPPPCCVAARPARVAVLE
ncbi:hypothetical protein GCM10028797_32980 [Dyella agri]